MGTQTVEVEIEVDDNAELLSKKEEMLVANKEIATLMIDIIKRMNDCRNAAKLDRDVLERAESVYVDISIKLHGVAELVGRLEDITRRGM